MTANIGQAALLEAAGRYYTARLREHGRTHWGVDWNSVEGQELRFKQLTRVFVNGNSHFSINDFGCGYGALYEYLAGKEYQFEYSGFDISAEMIESAEEVLKERKGVSLHVGHIPKILADYSVGSGIFHVKQDAPDEIWLEYILSTLDSMNIHSRRGFAFNCLTSYSDPHKMRGNLYYANPQTIFDYCMRKYSRHVALLHDYGLYEFTILVRKEL